MSHLRRCDARVSKPQRRDIPTDFPIYIAREVGEAVIVPSVSQLRNQGSAPRKIMMSGIAAQLLTSTKRTTQRPAARQR